MATTNPVHQVLVSSGNQAILAAGNRVGSLQHGQLGVFNYHTGLSIDGSVAGDAKDIFIAVGINRTSGAGAMEDLNQSAGQSLQVRHMKAYTLRGASNEVQQVTELTNFKTNCNSDYQLKIEFRSVKSYMMNGYNQFTKTFDVHTGPCADPCGADCGNGDGNDLATSLRDLINADTDKLVVASLFGYQIQFTSSDPTVDGTATFSIGTETFTVALLAADNATQAAVKIAAAINAVSASKFKASSTGAVITVFPKVAVKTGATDTALVVNANGTGLAFSAITAANANVTDSVAFKASFPGVGLGLRITGVAETRPALNGSINLKYHKTGTLFIVTATTGFDNGNSSVNTPTPLVMGQGSGYDIRQKEYEAGGFNGKPGVYRQSEITGLARDGFEYFAVATTNYDVYVLAYDIEAVAGWEKFKDNLMTTIAIPCADTTTLTGLATVLDAIFTQFGPMANDAASLNCNNPSVNTLTPATDGVESLS